VLGVGIVAPAGHVVNHSIGVDSDASCATAVDCRSELIASAHSPLEAIGDWLVGEVPRVHVAAEGLEGHDLLLGWEELHPHVPHLREDRAFLFDVSVWPHEELHDGSLLPGAIVASGLLRIITWGGGGGKARQYLGRVNFGGIPHKVNGVQLDGVALAVFDSAEGQDLMRGGKGADRMLTGEVVLEENSLEGEVCLAPSK
jgi:hypothetical protein